MKKLIADLMNHGYSEDQAKEFVVRCYSEFKTLVLEGLYKKANEALMSTDHDVAKRVFIGEENVCR